MNRIPFFIFATCLFSLAGFASGTLELQGKILSFDAAQISVQSGDIVYELDRKSLPESLVTEILKNKSAKSVKLAISTDSVLKMRQTKPAH